MLPHKFKSLLAGAIALGSLLPTPAIGSTIGFYKYKEVRSGSHAVIAAVYEPARCPGVVTVVAIYVEGQDFRRPDCNEEISKYNREHIYYWLVSIPDSACIARLEVAEYGGQYVS